MLTITTQRGQAPSAGIGKADAPFDVAVIGAGISGLATALRLQSAGLTTILFDAHGHPGGCAGYYRRHGFSFDVGATTLVDFGPGGVGGELLETVGLPPIDGEVLDGYMVWLPDRGVRLDNDTECWRRERLRAYGSTRAHRRLWRRGHGLARSWNPRPWAL